MKTLAFGMGLAISAVGACGLLAPASLVWLGRQFDSPGAFYVLATIRVAFGLVLLAVAPRSRAPRALRVVGFVVVTLGIAAAIAGLAAVGEARRTIEWWSEQGALLVRLTCVLMLSLGSFIAYACAPGSGRAGVSR